MLNKFYRSVPFVILCVAFLIPYNWWRIELMFYPINSETLKKSDVILYTTQWCPYCTKTRRFLQSAGIAFIEWDIEKSARAYQHYQLINGRGVPLIQIGPSIIQGYDQNAIRNAIDTLVKARQ